MSDHVTPEKAIEWLNGQLDGLGKIRNASTRDPAFRVWRQETLAFVQQIWPERPGRWHRFRRVPFAPSSPRADEKVARETFERGFAEMRRLLKMWVAEIKLKGLVGTDDASEGADEPPKPRKEAGKNKRPLKDMLGLGHLDLEPRSSRDTTGSSTADPKTGTPPAAPESTPDHLAQTISDALAEARPQRRPAHGSGKPPKPSASLGRPPGASGSAAGIAALAEDLEALEVPASEREPLKAALIELSRRLESGSITWEALQDAVALIMRYPALGRRALLLLLPYLDQAA